MMDTSDTQLNSVSTPIIRNEVMGNFPIPTPILYFLINIFIINLIHSFITNLLINYNIYNIFICLRYILLIYFNIIGKFEELLFRILANTLVKHCGAVYKRGYFSRLTVKAPNSKIYSFIII